MSERATINKVLAEHAPLVKEITQFVRAHLEFGSDYGLDGMIALAIGNHQEATPALPQPSDVGDTYSLAERYEKVRRLCLAAGNIHPDDPAVCHQALKSPACGPMHSMTHELALLLDEMMLALKAQPRMTADEVKLLQFVHDRLANMHGDAKQSDFMINLRELIASRADNIQPAAQWKPIAEAPRDGTLFDVYYADTGERYTDCHWVEKHIAVGKAHGYPSVLTVFASLPSHYMIFQPPHIAKEGGNS